MLRPRFYRWFILYTVKVFEIGAVIAEWVHSINIVLRVTQGWVKQTIITNVFIDQTTITSVSS